MVLKGSKGQITVIGIFMILIVLIVFQAIYPILSDIIDNVTGSGMDASSSLLFNMIPLIMVVVIIMSIWVYGTTRRTREEFYD